MYNLILNIIGTILISLGIGCFSILALVNIKQKLVEANKV